MQLAVLLHNFGGHKNIHQFIHFLFRQFYPNYIGKGRAFHGPLSLYILHCRARKESRTAFPLLQFCRQIFGTSSGLLGQKPSKSLQMKCWTEKFALDTYLVYSQCSSCAHGWVDEDTKVVLSLKSICQSCNSLVLLGFQTILYWIIFHNETHEKRGKGVQHNTSNIGFHQVFLFCFSCSFGDGWHSPCWWFFELQFPPIVVVEVSHCFVGVTVQCTSVEVINTCVRCRQTHHSLNLMLSVTKESDAYADTIEHFSGKHSTHNFKVHVSP